MSLPEIPEDAVRAAAGTHGSWNALEAAWPHLYAAALRHAAEQYEATSYAADGIVIPARLLRRLADEAARK